MGRQKVRLLLLFEDLAANGGFVRMSVEGFLDCFAEFFEIDPWLIRIVCCLDGGAGGSSCGLMRKFTDGV